MRRIERGERERDGGGGEREKERGMGEGREGEGSGGGERKGMLEGRDGVALYLPREPRVDNAYPASPPRTHSAIWLQ